MPRVHHVRKCRKAQGKCGKCSTEIRKGDPYLHWSFRYGGKHIRCVECPPRPRDLTQSDFWIQVYDAHDAIQALESPEDIDAVVGDLENLRDETQEKYDNMPDGLREGDTGQMLEERADGIDSLISDLEQAKDEWEQALEENDEENAEQAREDARNLEYSGS